MADFIDVASDSTLQLVVTALQQQNTIFSNSTMYIKGDSVHVRYSSYEDGTDYTETFSAGQKYIGVAVGQEAPENKEGYQWMLFEGKSAYATAVDNGFEGSESEWLASLIGADGEDGKNAYAYATEGGFVGEEEDFSKRLAGFLNLNIYDNAIGDVLDSELPLYRGLTEEADEHIVFTIADTEYIAKKDCTWNEWIESADNSGGYVIGLDNNVWYGEECSVLIDEATVAASDSIVDGGVYTHGN